MSLFNKLFKNKIYKTDCISFCNDKSCIQSERVSHYISHCPKDCKRYFKNKKIKK